LIAGGEGEMCKAVRSKEGFTLIELLIVVAIVGVLASIAIPAYTDYVKRSRMAEVLTAMDAIAQGAAEYHGSVGYFPDASYTAQNLAHFSELYAALDIVNGSNSDEILVQAAFNSSLDLIKDGNPSNCGDLVMRVNFNNVNGYGKDWDITQSTIDAMYMPKNK
jgi:type IV pilus assembly protein PilA